MNPLDEPMDQAFVSASPGPTIMKYSLIGIGGILLLSILTFTFGIGAGASMSTGLIASIITSLFSIILYVLIMVFAIKEHRDQHQKGFISLGKALLISYITGLIMATASIIFNLLYMLVINPNYMADSLGNIEGMEGMDTSTMLGGDYTMAIVFSTITSYVMGCVVGVFIALIVSAIMKKDLPFNTVAR
jgi:uncharacterized protein DUF4199